MMDAEKQLVHTLEELRDDLKQFIETRYEMLRTELSASLTKLRGGVVLIAIAAVFGLVGMILLGVCVAFAVGLFFGVFPNQGGVALGFLIVGVLALIVAGIAGITAASRLKAQELAPNRTLRVLQRDQQVLKQGGQPDVQRRRA